MGIGTLDPRILSPEWLVFLGSPMYKSNIAIHDNPFCSKPLEENMTRTRNLCLLFVIGFAFQSLGALPTKFARFPHFHQNKITFSFHGDLWLVDAQGKNPVQLTDHQARDEYPRFSPDGRWIAFTSNRMGNNDIWVVSSAGGEPRQLTFHSTNDSVLSWTPDGSRILFSTARGEMPWGSPLYTVDLEGNLPLPVEAGAAAHGMFSQDGQMLAFNRVRYRHPKKHYRGSGSANVWVKNLNDGSFRKLTNLRLEDYQQHANDAYPMWGADGKIYFMSDRDGVFNIWRISATGGNPEQVTKHRLDGVQFPSISPDGKMIVYSNEFEIWSLAVPRGQPHRIQVEIPYRHERNLTEFIAADSNADGFSPSPDGKFLAVDLHGEIYTVPSEEEMGEKQRITNSAWRQNSQSYSPDGKLLAYLSDESGDEEIWLHELVSGNRRKLTEQASKKTLSVWSPDSKMLLFNSGVHLYSIDIADGDVNCLASNPAGGIQPRSFSPDGEWLIYDRRDDFENREVYLYEISSQTEYNLTSHPAADNAGFLTSDQQTLVFVSNRGNSINQLYKVSLRRMAEDPEDPLVKAARAEQSRGRPSEADLDSPSPELAEIDLRAIQLTTESQAVGNFFLSADGQSIYYTVGSGGIGRRGGRGRAGGQARNPDSGLYSIDLEGENRRQVSGGQFPGLQPTQDRSAVFYRGQQGAIYKLALRRGAGPARAGGASRAAAPARGGRGRGGGGGNTPDRAPTASGSSGEKVSFNFSIKVDKREEWRQMFDEFYRHWKYSYVEEDMQGYDWDAIRARYEPLVDHIWDTQDFWDMAAEMLAELNSSHSGASPPRNPNQPPYQTLLPGFELEPADGKYRISHLYRGGPADQEWLDINEGDYVLAINGQGLAAGENYWPYLNDTLNAYLQITVADSASGANSRELRVKGTNSLRNIKYEEWIAENRDYVDQATNGQIAYLHIRAMNQPSLEKFRQEIDEFFYKKGIIIDVRFNGGGNIDQQLMDILERKPYQYTWTKTGSPVWGRRPKQTIVGPKIMLTNWRSGSDAEMTPHGFRHLGLGQLIGTPTVGAVVSARRFTLLDGGSTRIPATRVVSFDPSKPNNFGFNLENYGVPPDIWVRNSPQAEIDGRDQVLERAVQEILGMLESGTWQYEAPVATASGSGSKPE